MRIRSLFWWTVASPNVERMMNCFRAADITLICIRNSFWKKNSSGHEQYARRRGTRQSVRLALDAAAARVHEAVSLECGPCDGYGCHRDAAGVSAAVVFPACNRFILRACAE